MQSSMLISTIPTMLRGKFYGTQSNIQLLLRTLQTTFNWIRGWAYQSFHQYLSFAKYQISNETKYQSFNQYLNFPKYQDKRMLQIILNWTDGNINQSIDI